MSSLVTIAYILFAIIQIGELLLANVVVFHGRQHDFSAMESTLPPPSEGTTANHYWS
ncbi:MAG: hypothetical protein AAF483_18405 [Planctomycetota bacterium]